MPVEVVSTRRPPEVRSLSRLGLLLVAVLAFTLSFGVSALGRQRDLNGYTIYDNGGQACQVAAETLTGTYSKGQYAIANNQSEVFCSGAIAKVSWKYNATDYARYDTSYHCYGCVQQYDMTVSTAWYTDTYHVLYHTYFWSRSSLYNTWSYTFNCNCTGA